MADFDESDIPKEVPASEDYAAEPENVVRGHKAAVANPSMFFFFFTLYTSGKRQLC